MEIIIKSITIESEDKGAIIGGELPLNDNSDVDVELEDGRKFTATFFTYDNIQWLQQKNKNSGECLSGRFFWASNMLLIERIDRSLIEEVVNETILDGSFERVFQQL